MPSTYSALLLRALQTSGRRRLPRLATTLVATATATALLVPTAAPAVAGAPAPAPAPARAVDGTAPRLPGGVALTWSPAYMSASHDYSAAQARDLARANDIVVAMPVALGRHAGTMRSVNGDISLLAYANATLANGSETSGLGENAFAHDTSGRRITATGWGTALMESSSSAWRSRARNLCVDRARRGGFDGCLMDMLTLGIFSRGFVSSLPKNPATGRQYTQPEYQSQMVQLASSIRNASPGLVFSGNVVENSYRYWQSDVRSRTAALQMPSVQMEDFLRGAGSPAGSFPSAADWVRNVDVVRDLEAAGKVGLFTTKLWSSASSAQVAQWQAYAMATFLMGASGRSFFAFTRSRDRAGVLGTNVPYRMPKGLGAPSGGMQRQGSGAYVRRFANGMSVVNPTGRSVTVPLGRSMRRLNGSSTSSLTLAPSSGEVLTVAGSRAPASDRSAPGVSFRGRARGRALRLTGKATDNSGVKTVKVAVRNEATGRWLRGNGRWGAFRRHTVRLAHPRARTTSWSRKLRVPRGRYGVKLIAVDTSGNRSRRQPWRVYRVARNG